MKTAPAPVLLFLLLAVSFCSCGFEKRLYRPGFYLDRKKSLSQTSSRGATTIPVSHRIITTRVDQSQVAAPIVKKPADVLTPKTIPQKTFQKVIPPPLRKTTAYLPKQKSGPKDPPANAEPSNRLALIAFISAIAACVIYLSPYLLGIFIAGIGTLFVAMTVLGSLLLIFSLVLAIVALVCIIKHPDKYSGKKYAIAALAIDVLFPVLFAAVALLLLFGSM